MEESDFGPDPALVAPRPEALRAAALSGDDPGHCPVCGNGGPWEFTSVGLRQACTCERRASSLELADRILQAWEGRGIAIDEPHAIQLALIAAKACDQTQGTLPREDSAAG